MTNKAKILIVDDTPGNIHLLAETLKDEYAIMAATNGPKALQLCSREQKPDLVLLDVMMPEMDGHEVMRRLQADETTSPIPVVFVTAMSEDRDEEAGLSLGAVDYITKPFNPALVKARVKNHLELKHHRDHLEEEVKRRTDELLAARQAQARIEGELETARRLQLSMLKERQFSLGTKGELAAYLNPARSVGGDLFDYVVTSEEKLLLCLGDVSDKGTGAALFMVKTLTLFRAFSQSERRPERLLERINESLCQQNDEFMFVTLTCCLLDAASGEFSWASGGHEPLLKFGGDGCRYIPQDTGPALGLMEDAQYPLHTDRLGPGEGLLLYSDGITEAQKSDGVEFGEERLREQLDEAGSLAPDQVCERLVDRVDKFLEGAEQFDDMAILAVKRSESA